MYLYPLGSCPADRGATGRCKGRSAKNEIKRSTSDISIVFKGASKTACGGKHNWPFSPNTESQSLIYSGGGRKRKKKKKIKQSREIGEREGSREAVGRRTAAAESRPLP